MIRFEHVNKTFAHHQALKDVTVDFPENKVTVIVGPSGSGKSTLLRSLNLLERPESGLYHFNDQTIDFAKPISDKTTLSIRRQTGMVFQSYNLFTNLTVLHNITEGPILVLKQSKQDAEANARRLLEKVGLADKADAYPQQLSGGQAQRVAIARSLAMKPQYMLLDEPTSALDPELELEVLKVLLSIAKEKQSMVIVTHNMAFASQVADKIVFVDNGKVDYDGEVEPFFHSDQERIKNFVSAMTFSDFKD